MTEAPQYAPQLGFRWQLVSHPNQDLRLSVQKNDSTDVIQSLRFLHSCTEVSSLVKREDYRIAQGYTNGTLTSLYNQQGRKTWPQLLDLVAFMSVQRRFTVDVIKWALCSLSRIIKALQGILVPTAGNFTAKQGVCIIQTQGVDIKAV